MGRPGLLIVDLQADRLPGGRAPHPELEDITLPLAALGSAVDRRGGLLVATLEGDSALPRALRLPKSRIVARRESGSPLAARVDGSSVSSLLRDEGVTDLIVGGAPAEGAVLTAVLEALDAGCA